MLVSAAEFVRMSKLFLFGTVLLAVCQVVIGRFCPLCAFGNIFLKRCICKIHAPIWNILDVGNQAVLSGCIQRGNTNPQNLGSFFSCNQFFHTAIDRFLYAKPKLNRNIFVRRYYHLYAIRDIADAYGMSESKVTSLLFRMRNELRRFLEKEEIMLRRRWILL